MNKTENSRPDVIFAVMKLMRSMRRRPPKPGEGFHPGMDRPLLVLAENDNVSSRELAELLDIRPSSLTELLSRLESEGLVCRAPDENDRRVSRVSLTDKGREQADKMKAEHEQRRARTCACFTDEEAEQFCALCERLGEHLQAIAKEDGEDCGDGDDFMPPHHHHHHHHMHDFRHGPMGGARPHCFPPRSRKL